MWDDCGNTGCAGGGSFTVFVFFIWIAGSGMILFGAPTSIKDYVLSFIPRVFLVVIFSAICYGVTWLLATVGL
jgi:flagellar biosynthesis protein FliQ